MWGEDMKKKYLGLILLVIGMFFLGINNVKAAEKIGWGTCTYKMDNSSMQDTFNKYVDNNIRENNTEITFGFSEILGSGDSNNLFVTTTYSNDKWFAVYQEKGNQFAAKNLDNTGAQLGERFHKFINTNGKCPQYFVLKKGTKNVESLFFESADEKNNYCGNNNCPFTSTYKSGKFTTVQAGEDIWVYQGINKSKASVDLYVSSGSEIRAHIIVPQSSEYYSSSPGSYNESYGGKVIDSRILCKDMAMCAREVESLMLNKQFSYMTWFPTQASDAVYIGYEKSGKNRITENNVSFTKGTSCNTFARYSEDVKKSVEEVVNQFSWLKNNEKYKGVLYEGDLQARTFNNAPLTEEYYKKIMDTYDELMASKKLNDFTSLAENAFDKINNISNEICESQRKDAFSDQIAILSRTYVKDGGKSEYARFLAAIKGTINNLKSEADRHNIAISSELTNRMDEAVANIEDKEASLNNFYARFMSERSYIVGLDLAKINGGEGCDLISHDLAEFLNIILWYVKIVGIVLAIVLSLIDYIKSAAASDEKSMSAANKRMITRFILVAVLFLLPAILEFILGALNISTTAGSLECLNK